jgi:histidinol-phosphate/aromatic aminotransferase/cobyric acid decarboxylase-like protein/adenosyl cobinamide kinase/adenosyl cobinamide phosphate guanylyltransferase
MSLTLVIGGTRSGKSAHAERLAAAGGQPVRYIATADGADASMAARIAAHRDQRPSSWDTVEATGALSAAIAADGVSLIDGLGTWLGGVLHRTHTDSAGVMAQIELVIEAARERDVIVVAEEAGQGLLPGDALSRTWLDLLGEAIQRLSAAADRVDFVVAGRPIRLPPAQSRPGASAPPAPGFEQSLRHHGDREVREGDSDHAVNVLAGGPPEWLAAALAQTLEQAGDRYPDERAAMAETAAAHGRGPEEIVPANGAAEALWLLGPALRPRLAAVVHPGFTEAEAGLHAHRIPVVRVLRDPDHGFALDPAAVPAEADLVIVGNPGSPDGTLHPSSSLLALRAPGRVLVVDEAFMGMVPGEPGSLAGEPLADVIVTRSLTKVLSIPGLRAGYAIAPEPLAARLRAVRPPWSANALALTAMIAAARRPAELEALARRAAAEREDLDRRLTRIAGVRSWPSLTNFCLIEVADGQLVLGALRERRIAVRPASSFPGLGPGHLRITARAPERNAAVAAAIAEALA